MPATTYDDILDAYPADLEAAIARTRTRREQLAMSSPELAWIADDLARWPNDDVITVAFLGGSHDLHEAIASVAAEITDSCGIALCFGEAPAAQGYRRWSVDDVHYQADIRVSFDQQGYWSLVGTDSIASDLAPSELGVGGAPHQRSLNLGGFDRRLTEGWRRIVLRQFLHALALGHEQDLVSQYQQDFRWNDDVGYEPTTDRSGRFVADAEDRRPGIYTYLSGAPNHWDKTMVDHNLRTPAIRSAVAGDFDVESVMSYRLAPLFYKSSPSPWAPTSEGDDLSDGDVRSLRLLYPSDGREATERSNAAMAARAALHSMGALQPSSEGFTSAVPAARLIYRHR